MPQLENKPEPFRRGQSQISASSMAMIVNAVLRQIHGGGGTNTSYFGDRVLLQSPRDVTRLQDPTNHLMQFVVLQEFPDYLLCAKWNPPDTTGLGWQPQVYNKNLEIASKERVYVAKPYHLQTTPWQSATTNAPGNLTNITYNPDGVDTPYGYRRTNGTRNLRGTTNSTFNNNHPALLQKVLPEYISGEVIYAVRAATGYVDPDNAVISWMDANLAARRWSNVGISGFRLGASNEANNGHLGDPYPLSDGSGFGTAQPGVVVAGVNSPIPWNLKQWDSDGYVLGTPPYYSIQLPFAGNYLITVGVNWGIFTSPLEVPTLGSYQRLSLGLQGEARTQNQGSPYFVGAGLTADFMTQTYTGIHSVPGEVDTSVNELPSGVTDLGRVSFQGGAFSFGFLGAFSTSSAVYATLEVIYLGGFSFKEWLGEALPG